MRVVPCPQCGAAVEWESCETRPFCSERCKLIDLGAWIDERYRISQTSSDADAADDGAARGGADDASDAEPSDDDEK